MVVWLLFHPVFNYIFLIKQISINSMSQDADSSLLVGIDDFYGCLLILFFIQFENNFPVQLFGETKNWKEWSLLSCNRFAAENIWSNKPYHLNLLFTFGIQRDVLLERVKEENTQTVCNTNQEVAGKIIRVFTNFFCLLSAKGSFRTFPLVNWSQLL